MKFINFVLCLFICYCLFGWSYVSIQAGIAQNEPGPIIGGIFPLICGIIFIIVAGSRYMTQRASKRPPQEPHKADEYFAAKLRENLTREGRELVLEARRIRHDYPDMTGPYLVALVYWGAAERAEWP